MLFSRRTNRSSRRRLGLQSLEKRRVFAALGAGNILVSYDASDSVHEYTDSGALVQEIPIYPVSSGKPRDLTVDSAGNVNIFFGTFTPTLEIIDPVNSNATSVSIPGWSTVSNISYGGIADYENFVFLTDMQTGGGPEEGLIRFNESEASYERFASDKGFNDLTLGRDGLLYALEEYTPARHIRVYDPISLQEQRRFSLPHVDHRGIAVDADGNLYTPMWSGGEIRKYDSQGNLLTTLSTGINNLQDIDLHSDGRLVVGSWGGDVVVTDTSLTSFTTFDTGSTSSIFVAFSDDDPVVTPNEAPTTSPLEINVPEGDRVAFGLSATDDHTPENELVFVIEGLPSGGDLTYDGHPVYNGQTFIGAPQLEFELGAESGTLVTTMYFTVSDSATPSLTSDYERVTFTKVESVGAGEVTIDAEGIVRIGGTSLNDKFIVQPNGSNLEVKHNGTIISDSIPLASITEIRGWGRDGNDTINVKNLTIDTILYGGDGNDKLYGGHGRDLMFGGLGDDIMRGRRGSDIVIGGWDQDDLRGNRDDDIMVGGTFDSALTLTELDKLLADWDANHDAAVVESAFAGHLYDEHFDMIRGNNNVDILFASIGDDVGTSSDTVVTL